MKRYLPIASAVFLASGCLVACGAAPGATMHGAATAAVANATRLEVAVRPEIRAAAYATQAVVTPYTAADVDHLTIEVLDPQGNTQASVTVPQAQIGQVVTLTNLAPNTTYTLLCQAFDASGDLISVDSQSQMALAVGNDDVLAPITLTVQLQNVVFSGVATGAISVADGTVLPPDQPVAITILTALP